MQFGRFPKTQILSPSYACVSCDINSILRILLALLHLCLALINLIPESPQYILTFLLFGLLFITLSPFSVISTDQTHSWQDPAPLIFLSVSLLSFQGCRILVVTLAFSACMQHELHLLFWGLICSDWSIIRFMKLAAKHETFGIPDFISVLMQETFLWSVQLSFIMCPWYWLTASLELFIYLSFILFFFSVTHTLASSKYDGDLGGKCFEASFIFSPNSFQLFRLAMHVTIQLSLFMLDHGIN